MSDDEDSYQVPEYKPQHVLSPEFNGTSNYEMGLGDLLKEKTRQLELLKQNPNTPPHKLKKAEDELKKLERLYENYNSGMNVFRTAKGGRDKVRE